MLEVRNAAYQSSRDYAVVLRDVVSGSYYTYRVFHAGMAAPVPIANGGTGAPGNQTKTHGQSLTLSSVKPTKDGYTFQGWSTSSTGSVQYNPGSAYTGNANLTLYAVWKSAHTHSYQRFPETMHPHRVYYICSCGASYYAVENGQYVTEKLSTCSSCYPVTGVSLNKTSETCEPETVFSLTATVTPSNAANKSLRSHKTSTKER